MTPKGYGGYDPVLPLDELILRALPKEGSLIAGVYPDGKSGKDLSREIPGNLPAALMSTRGRVLKLFGLVTSTKTVRTGAKVYQITPQGEAFLRSLNSASKEEAGDDDG